MDFDGSVDQFRTNKKEGTDHEDTWRTCKDA